MRILAKLDYVLQPQFYGRVSEEEEAVAVNEIMAEQSNLELLVGTRGPLWGGGCGWIGGRPGFIIMI